MENNSKSSNLIAVYLFGFFSAFSAALMAYVDSSFLKIFIKPEHVGSVFTFSYIFVVFFFLIMPYVLRSFGNFKVSLFIVLAELLALLGIVFLDRPEWIITCVIINLITIPLIYFSLDIFLEGYSSDKETGVLRGIYLTVYNLAWVFSQLIGGSFLVNNNYQNIYLVSFCLLLPTVLVLFFGLRKFKDSEYKVVKILQTIKSVWNNKNIFNIFMVNFLLYFFYSWMIIYMPIYLNTNMGLSWKEIGIIFSIMLLPFVFVQFPLGYLADKKYGEKEILVIGFIIIFLSTGLIFFVNGGSVLLWALILFSTRVGAAAVEVMSNTYFFKKVKSLDANIISFFRMSGTFAYMLAPLLATLLLSFFHYGMSTLFLILGLIMLTGIKFSLSIKDTK